MDRYFKKYYILFFCVTAFIFTLLTVSKPFAQEKSQYLNDEHQMNYQQEFQPSTQISSDFSSNEHQIILLYAEELNFESYVEFPSSVRINPDKYTESITDENNGAIDITLINQGNTIKYLFQVSSIPKQQCGSDATRVCQQGAAAPARGNIAEFQIVLQGIKLMPGIYTFGEAGATPIEDVMIYSRQLYSDPSHGKLGCQVWGAGTFNVKKAVYNVDGKLEYLDVSLSRLCEQTAPFPPILPQENLLQVEVENIKIYTYHASWRCHMKLAGEVPK